MAGSSATARRPPAQRASKASSMPSLPKPAAPAGFPHVRPGRPGPAPRPAVADLDAPADRATGVDGSRRRGRGAQSNMSGRFEPLASDRFFDDGWRSFEELPPFKTTVTIDATRKIITRNDSPDIGFDRSINPYRGCEHGCTIASLGRRTLIWVCRRGSISNPSCSLSPSAPELLERELPRRARCRVDRDGHQHRSYQPIEREYR